jgi:hypothetical protein
MEAGRIALIRTTMEKAAMMERPVQAVTSAVAGFVVER